MYITDIFWCYFPVGAAVLAYPVGFACRTGRAFTASRLRMYRNENERLSDTIMGEAVIELLDERAPITNAQLLLKLQTFLLAAEETWREAAIRSAIRSVQAAVLDGNSRTGAQSSSLH